MSELTNRQDITIYGLPTNPTIGTIAIDSSDGYFKQYNGSSWVNLESSSGSQVFAFLTDVRASTTTTPASAATTWNVRNLNTLVDPSGIVLNPASFTGTGGTNTTITLGAGTYLIEADCVATQANVNGLKVRFRNTSDNTTPIVGESGYQNAFSGTLGFLASLKGQFTIAASKNFQLQYYTTAVGTNVAMTNTSEVEIFSSVKIIKVS
jgi:hypothetical protein